MSDRNKRVCPIKHAGFLDNRIRKLLQDPQKILVDYVKDGMTVLDLGCGPGFFSMELAEMVGVSGQVIAADLQEGMLQKLKTKIEGKDIEKRIKLHKCEEDKIGVSEQVDFILAFYIVHEVPSQKEFFREIRSILKPNGKVLVVEPPFSVSKVEFEETIIKAMDAGFTVVERPKVFLSKTAIFKIANHAIEPTH
ncbi:MAG: methyltransferase type 11 [Nitrospirae bacterium RBG_16_43_8]|nr:MAG: methyltransferase type 11 [Nitrospirae bacterium RBG_16_43_8]